MSTDTSKFRLCQIVNMYMIFLPDSVELLEIIKFYTAKRNDIWIKNDKIQ
jgi:hypothetical protein